MHLDPVASPRLPGIVHTDATKARHLLDVFTDERMEPETLRSWSELFRGGICERSGWYSNRLGIKMWPLALLRSTSRLPFLQ